VIGGGLVLIDSDLDTKGLEQIVEQVVSAAMDELVKQEAE